MWDIERNPLRVGIVRDLRKYRWSSFGVYGYGEEDGLTDRHEIYENMGKDPFRRQRAYVEYVCSSRDREGQEIREKMGRGIIGTEGFQTIIAKKVIEEKRPRRGRLRK